MALKRKTMEKAIKSTIAPNPKEFTHQTDLSADPCRSIRTITTLNKQLT